MFEGAMLMTMYYMYMCTLLTELFYPLQLVYTLLQHAVMGGHSICVERLLSTPGIDVNIKDEVSWSTEYSNKIYTVIGTVANIASHYTFWFK